MSISSSSSILKANSRAACVSVDVLNALRTELEAKAVGIQDGHWGYETMIVEDPDDNEPFFPYPVRDCEEG